MREGGLLTEAISVCFFVVRLTGNIKPLRSEGSGGVAGSLRHGRGLS